MTVFLGCGFAAKYREGGGNFSVPLQWMLGLRRLKRDAIWLELLPASKNTREDEKKIANFQRQLRAHGLAGRYCLLYQAPAGDIHDFDQMRCIGLSKRELRERMTGPTTLLNLSYSIHPPLLSQFERRIFCDLDPGEIFYWMTQLEMGQSYHHEFWTIGLNVNGAECRLPRTGCKWQTFYPLVDTKLIRPQARPRAPKFTTIGQWYWDGLIEVAGEFPNLSKKAAFEKYLDLPQRVPEAQFELAMNLGTDEAERTRLQKLGWKLSDPHKVARTPRVYRRYLAGALGEFTAIKGIDVIWQTGWVSDRAAAFAAMGRPVITEDTGAAKYLLPKSGFLFVKNAEEAVVAMKKGIAHWPRLSQQARQCAVELFDGPKNLRRILG